MKAEQRNRKRQNRVSRNSAAALLVALVLAMASGSAFAHRGWGTDCAAGDFNGDLYEDLVVVDRGLVSVLYGSYRGLRVRLDYRVDWTPDSIAVGDFNGDGKDDVAFGTTTITAARRGAVKILYGSRYYTPPASWETWTQNSPGIKGMSELGDRFGSEVAAGRLNGDRYDDLAIGVPGEDNDAGAVNIIFGTPHGLHERDDRLITQNSGFPAMKESGDLFGATLAIGSFDGGYKQGLAIGAPGEDIGSVPDAGAVLVIFFESWGTRTSSHAQGVNLPGAAEPNDRLGWSLAAGDFDGDRVDDLAVGIPGQRIAGRTAAGAVQVLYGEQRLGFNLRTDLYYQNAWGIAGSPEYRDEFGTSLTAGDFNGDGRDDLAIGIPYEDVAHLYDGMVQVLYRARYGLRYGERQFLHQNVPGVPDECDLRDLFGFALAAGDFNRDGKSDLVVTAPQEHHGKIHVFEGRASGGVRTYGSLLLSRY